jgi:hypothetical protein
MSAEGYIVLLLRPGLSADSAARGNSPYVVKSKDPLVVDAEAPAVFVANAAQGQEPTIFANEEEAQKTVENIVNRVRAIQRVGQQTGQWRDIGAASLLIPQRYGGSEEVGGFEVVESSYWTDERDEEQKLHAAAELEEVAEAERRAQEAAEAAEQARSNANVSPDWRGMSVPYIQERTVKDGSKRYRARKAGRTSPTFENVADALEWRDAETAQPA